MTVGERIRERRKECGMTQAEVAKKAGISRSYFSDVEKDYYNPSIDTLKSIAAALGTTSGILLDDASALEYAAVDNGLTGALKLFEADRTKYGSKYKNYVNKALTLMEEDERMREFASLFSKLSPDERKLVIAQMKGILSEK